MFIIRIFLLVIHIIVFALLSATFLNEIVPPKVFPMLNFLSLVFPILLILHLFLTAIWVIMWRKRAIVFLLFSFLFFNPAQRWVNFSPLEKNDFSVKVISLNAHGGKEGEEKIASFLEKERPDIFFVQEGFFYNDKKLEGYEKTKNDDFIHIFSKFPILNSGKIYSENDDIGTAIFADIDYNGKTIRLINYYLEPFQLDLEEKQAQNIDENYLNKFGRIFKKHQPQAIAISRAVKDSPHPVIVAGDMNAVPNSYEYYQILGDLVDSFQASGKGIGTTFSETIIPIKIDYIFASNKIKPLKSNIYKKEKLSDHSAVISEFRIK